MLFNASTGKAVFNSSTGGAVFTSNTSGCSCCTTVPPFNASGCTCTTVTNANGSTWTLHPTMTGSATIIDTETQPGHTPVNQYNIAIGTVDTSTANFSSGFTSLATVTPGTLTGGGRNFNSSTTSQWCGWQVAAFLGIAELNGSTGLVTFVPGGPANASGGVTIGGNSYEPCWIRFVWNITGTHGGPATMTLSAVSNIGFYGAITVNGVALIIPGISTENGPLGSVPLNCDSLAEPITIAGLTFNPNLTNP